MNVLTSPWLEVFDRDANLKAISPVDAIEHSSSLLQIVESSPLDLFAAHRFLLTLLYWKGGTTPKELRSQLLSGKGLSKFCDGLRSESDSFEVFDAKRPFLQDPSVAAGKKLSAASLFAELAAGTNLSHFHHADDKSAQLCLRCATLGLLRLVPWTQSGGAGKSPSIHGAPPISILALGEHLGETLSRNLVDIPKIRIGKPQWSGQFKPTPGDDAPSLMEALTWNPRRVHLGSPEKQGNCSNCGRTDGEFIGPIVYEKPGLGQAAKTISLSWKDPAFFFNASGITVKTSKEDVASTGDDLRSLYQRTFGKKVEPAPESAIVKANTSHDRWLVVLPCTNPANNKSFDHRTEIRNGFTGPAPNKSTDLYDEVPSSTGDPRVAKLFSRRQVEPTEGAHRFVNTAFRLKSSDWATLGGMADQTLNNNSAAFDIFTSLYWTLRERPFRVPSRNAAWLFLKLAASVKDAERKPGKAKPWQQLRAQTNPTSETKKLFPRRLPSIHALELELREAIRSLLATTQNGIDWTGLCQFLDDVLPPQ